MDGRSDAVAAVSIDSNDVNGFNAKILDNHLTMTVHMCYFQIGDRSSLLKS